MLKMLKTLSICLILSIANNVKATEVSETPNHSASDGYISDTIKNQVNIFVFSCFAGEEVASLKTATCLSKNPESVFRDVSVKNDIEIYAKKILNKQGVKFKDVKIIDLTKFYTTNYGEMYSVKVFVIRS